MGLRAVLTWAAITRVERGVELAVRNSKTIQFFERVHTIPLVALFYPVHALDLLIELDVRCPELLFPHTSFQNSIQVWQIHPVEKADFPRPGFKKQCPCFLQRHPRGQRHADQRQG